MGRRDIEGAGGFIGIVVGIVVRNCEVGEICDGDAGPCRGETGVVSRGNEDEEYCEDEVASRGRGGACC